MTGMVWGISHLHQQLYRPSVSVPAPNTRCFWLHGWGWGRGLRTDTPQAQCAPFAFSEPTFALNLIITYLLPFSNEDFTENASRTV